MASQCMCISLAFICIDLRRLTRFPPYGVTMRVFYSRYLHRFRRPYEFSSVFAYTMCVFFKFLCTSVSLSFKMPYDLFLLYGVTMRVFYLRFYIVLDVLRVLLRMASSFVYITRLCVSFKTPYAFSCVLGHNAVCFSRFLFTRVSLSFKTPYAFSCCMASQCVCFTRVSASF